MSRLLFNFALEYAIRRIQENRIRLELNGKHYFLVYADGINMLGGNLQTVRENNRNSHKRSRVICLEVNSEMTKYMITSRQQNVVQNQNMVR